MVPRDWKAGCAGFPIRREAYFARFPLVEVQETFYDPPSRRILVRWREKAPEPFVFALRAWQLITHPPGFEGYARIQRNWKRDLGQGFGHFRPGEDVRWAWSVTREAADTLKAGVIVFHTPASFTPTRENRRNLADFFSGIERGPFRLAWETGGIWEEGEVKDLCGELGLIAVVDPLLSLPQPGDFFYCRLRSPRHRRAGVYTADDFSRMAERILVAGGAGNAQGYFIFDTADALRDAEGFSRWLKQESAGL